MQPSTYLCAEKFPRTTQKGLSLKNQLLIDAFNFDQLMEYAQDNELSDEQQQIRAELEEKSRAWPELRRQLRESE